MYIFIYLYIHICIFFLHIYIYIYIFIYIFILIFEYIYIYLFISVSIFFPQNRTKWSARKLFTLLGCFLEMFETMFNNSFNLCSHIELNTQNPNPIFKITIDYTIRANNDNNYIRTLGNFSNLSKQKKRKIRNETQFYCVCYINCIIHILQCLDCL